ncbi:hypothetical protein [Metabacillus litoralis]|uniref:hypothetical protein n=1 Tax=Metabacillus litoralis TaxID=152268 RepID=UPI00214C17D6|nr:hypothetical protein [Metabacillus litoralis]
MINRRLITGDAYAFQGDERDIIFLSMVIAPNVRFASLSKRSDLQRYNVAASRGRDQMILFHSVDLSQLNPNDIRYQLLQYCKQPYRVQEALKKHEKEFDSEFEKDVYSLILSRGYRVIPQVKVGTLGKKIDLVVEGMRTRLAVECDGDRWLGLEKWEEDMDRQRVLERVGWTFWRVRGSAFYANPANAMESLWVKLDGMGIEPNILTADEQVEIIKEKDNVEDLDMKKSTNLNMEKTLENLPEENKDISNVLKSHPEQKNPIPIKIINQNSQEIKQGEEHSNTQKTPTNNRNQPVKIKQLELFTSNKPEQLKLFEDQSSKLTTTLETKGNKIKKTDSLVAYLKGQGFDVIDMRTKGGALW